MRALRKSRTFILAVLTVLTGTPAHAQAPVFKAGFAERDITPEIGSEIPGGYETRLTSYSNLEVPAGGRLRDAGLGLAKELTPGAVPVPPKPAPFSQAWSYGNVKPEAK